MGQNIQAIETALKNVSVELPTETLKEYINEIKEAQELFPQTEQDALIVRLLNEWKKKKNEKIITVTSDVCLLAGKRCLTCFGILSHDWPGLSNACLGVINEMGWNIYFVKGFSFIYHKQQLGIVIIGIRTDQDAIYKRILGQTATILTKLHQAAVGTGAKAYLIAEEIRKLEIYGQVITSIEKIYHEPDLEHIVGLNGEAVKYFAARSRDYIQNREVEDIAKQIIQNYTFIKTAHKTGNTIQLDISNFTTKTEGTFTGVTLVGPATLLNLEDCLKTIELTVPNFQLKHNREFTTNAGISLYRIEFVDHLGHPLSDLDRKRLQTAFSTMVLNKRRDRAQWIESIGGFEQYARAIIPLLVREAQNTGKTQVYQSVGHTTELNIDFKVIIVTPFQKEMRKKLVTDTVNAIEEVSGLHILSVKPPKTFGSTEVFIIDLRASLTIIDDVESIYQIIRSKIQSSIGQFRDFDEGMRSIDANKLKTVRRLIEGVDKTLLRELFYSIEDFFRLSATIDEIVAHIRIILDMLAVIDEKDQSVQIISRQTCSHSKSGRMIPHASLLCIGYPHEKNLLQKILQILEPFEVTLSRLERTGRDILVCRVTEDEKALKKQTLNQLVEQLKKM